MYNARDSSAALFVIEGSWVESKGDPARGHGPYGTCGGLLIPFGIWFSSPSVSTVHQVEEERREGKIRLKVSGSVINT
jgi:hypothetical protein